VVVSSIWPLHEAIEPGNATHLMLRFRCSSSYDIRQASSVWQGYLAAEDRCSQSATTRLTFSTSLCRQRRIEALACTTALIESGPSAVSLVSQPEVIVAMRGWLTEP
jgi:hypothetical protein